MEVDPHADAQGRRDPAAFPELDDADLAALDALGTRRAVEAEPASEWLQRCVTLDGHGFVLTDQSLSDANLDERWQSLGRRPLAFETSLPGLFAVGDMRSGSMKRVAAAVGEGSSAVRSVHEYLALAR